MRIPGTTLLFVLCSTAAFAQTTEPAPVTRYSIGAAVSPGATLVTQIAGLARFPSPKKDFDVLGGVALGMVFYSRIQQKEIGAFENKAPYGTLTFGIGYQWAAVTVGFGVRIEDRIRASGEATSTSWMHTGAAH